MNAIYERTSVRQFTDQTLTQEQVNAILKAGFCAPSARNLQPWYFVVIEKESLIRQLQEFSPYASPLQTATLAIVVCADLSINPSTDYCQQDCAAATQNMLVQAKELGIGSCWMGGYPNQDRIEKIKEIIALPEHILPLWILAFGIPNQNPPVKDKWNEEKILRL